MIYPHSSTGAYQSKITRELQPENNAEYIGNCRPDISVTVGENSLYGDESPRTLNMKRAIFRPYRELVTRCVSGFYPVRTDEADWLSAEMRKHIRKPLD